MATTLAIAGWTLFALAVLVGIGLNVFGLFGNWIILSAVVAAWLVSGFTYFSIWSILVLLALAGLGELLEAIAAGYGASKFGGTRGTMVASIVGAIAGAMLGAPLGLIIGALAGGLAGAFAGAILYELIQAQKSYQEAVWTGFGAALGKLGGVFAKLMIGFIMLATAFGMMSQGL